MKRTILSLLFLISTISGMYAADLQTDDKRICDSIFQIVRRMPLDTTRIAYLQKIYKNNQDAAWTLQLLNGALALSRKFEAKNWELSILENIYYYYSFRDNIKTMANHCLPNIKAACYKYKEYDLYFLLWSDFLNRESDFGNIATVNIQAEAMRQEADSLNFPEGVIVADMVLAGALVKSNQFKESMELNQKILKSSLPTHAQKRIIYQRLSTAYQRKGEFDKALECLDKSLFELKRVGNVNSEDLRTQRISIELGYCFLVQEMAETQKLKDHLDVLKQFYHDGWKTRNKVSYHSYWGSYYYLTGNKEKSYEEYDLASQIGKENRNTFMISVHEMKAQCAAYYKDYDVAAQAYKNAVQLCYSINLDIAHKNKEAIQANFRIRKALLERENSVRDFNTLKISATSLLLIALIVGLWHIIHTNRRLYCSAKETREALKQVDAANRMKEIFLRNINEEIKEPIDTVIKCSTLLSSADDLSQEDRVKYSAKIKIHATHLIQLVNNVLDLSRLEAGMTKFNAQENDLVSLCADVKLMLGMQETNHWKQTFSTEIETLRVLVDSTWFCRVMGFLLSSPEECKETYEANYTLTVEGHLAHIIINVPLIKLQTFNSNERINWDIARLYLETVGGSCEINGNTIEITYPVLKN